MLHRCNVREWEWEGKGKALWESHGYGNWLQNWEWEWEGMGIDCTGMGGSGNVKKPFTGISNVYVHAVYVLPHIAVFASVAYWNENRPAPKLCTKTSNKR